ncbi:MAG: DNA internalization-related competence protein ComEC/Rec2 [Candidatus Latescibacteria bacterium]|nr:DNA internalization-related competence protein ComEC/Rec2 [Candidatus Latescibacterota bacterium]
MPVRLWLLLLMGYAAAGTAPVPAAAESTLRVAAGLLGALSLSAALAGGRRPNRSVSRGIVRPIEIMSGAAALLAAGGCLRAEADRAARPLPVHPRRTAIEVSGLIVETVPADAKSATVLLEARSVRVGSTEASCRATLVLRWDRDAPQPTWASPGLWIALRGEYRPPEDARNPGCGAPGRWLERLRLSGTVDLDPTTIALSPEPHESEVLWSGLMRHRLARMFSRDLSGPVAALARGMSLGDRSGIAPSVRDAFRDGGTIHILSISGLHVCVLAAIVGVVVVAVRLPAIPALLTELAFLWAYVLLVGAPASAVRSAILWTAMRGGRLRGTAVRPFAAWGLAGLLLMIGDPGVLADPGFQLSFAAVLGLSAAGGLTASRELTHAGSGIASRARAAAGAIVSLARQGAFAEAGTLGIQVVQFGAVPIAGLILNLAVIPLCGAFMAAMLLHLGCAAILPALAPAAAGAVEVPGLLMLWLTAQIAGAIPPVPVRSVPPTPAIVAGLFALLVAAAVWERSRIERGRASRRAAMWTAAAALAVSWGVGFVPSARQSSSKTPWLLALDVGQGDALLAKAPGGTLLVDAGPSSESRDEGRYAVEPALRAEGIVRVDAAILSHAHRDHFGGLSWLAARGFIGTVYENGSDPGAPWRDPIRRGLERAGGRLAPIRSDTTITLGADRPIRVLRAPTPPHAGTANTEENNRSLVAMVSMGRGSVCFPGDVERDAEVALVPSVGPAAVLKVPHHGSKTSSDAAWLDAIRPRIAIISCGERNRFGHPDRATIGRCLLRGTRVLRTDAEGSIRLTFVEGGIYVSTRAHPAPELIPWNPTQRVARPGQSP